MIDVDTKYNTGDVVTINKKDWTIKDITMRFGRIWMYGLERENKEGVGEHFSIETGSLKTLMGENNGKTSKKTWL